MLLSQIGALAQVALTAGAFVSYAGVMDAVYYDASSGHVFTLNAAHDTPRAERDPLTIPPMGTHSGRTALVPGFMAGVQAASLQQQQIADAGPGVRLPEAMNPLLVLEEGAPVLASSAIGVALQEATVENILNVLDFGMDPARAADQPNSEGPFVELSTTGPAKVAFDKEAFRSGDFPETALEGLRRRGQPVQMVGPGQQDGYWIGIAIDPRTGVRRGGVTSKIPALVESY